MHAGPVPYTCAVLTISTTGAKGQREDVSGPTAVTILRDAGFAIAASEIVADKVNLIADVLRRWADHDRINLIVTTGGTGLAQSDVTPEATRSVIDREVPGLPEAMRLHTLANTPMAMLSRGIAGTRGGSLIVNLPGSPKAVQQCLEVLVPVLGHAVGLLSGAQTGH